MNSIGDLVVLALASVAIALATSRSWVFRPFRSWVRSKSAWFGELVSCWYCTCHWVAAAMTAWYRPRIMDSWLPVDLIVGWFVIVSLSLFMGGLIQLIVTFPSREDG